MTDVRAATADDARVIADINVRSWRHAYRGIIPDSYLAALDETVIARRVRDVVLSGSATILVAASPEVRGFSWMSHSRDDDAQSETAEIVAIYVDPQYERRGIGCALALTSCDVARSQGFTRIGLWVFDENASARAFYEALEFAPDGRTKTTSRWGGVPIREVRYVRSTTTNLEEDPVSEEVPSVRAFFEQYARARSARDVDLIASQYTDPFMFADPNGARPVEKASLLAVFPKGLQLLKTHGHTATNLRSLDETVVDEHYRFVRAQFVWCFEKPGRPDIEVDVDATFMVYVKGSVLTIVLQQEREDFRDAARSKGIELA